MRNSELAHNCIFIYVQTFQSQEPRTTSTWKWQMSYFTVVLLMWTLVSAIILTSAYLKKWVGNHVFPCFKKTAKRPIIVSPRFRLQNNDIRYARYCYWIHDWQTETYCILAQTPTSNANQTLTAYFESSQALASRSSLLMYWCQLSTEYPLSNWCLRADAVAAAMDERKQYSNPDRGYSSFPKRKIKKYPQVRRRQHSRVCN